MTGTTTQLTGRAVPTAPQPDALRFLPGWDYADAFTIEAGPPVRARVWAEAAVASGPPAMQRAFGLLVWHAVLGFDLAAADADGAMVGWTIAVDEPSVFVLTARGRSMTGCMVFSSTGTSATWTTALHFRTPYGKRVWSVAQHAHRALAGRLLTRAARTISD